MGKDSGTLPGDQAANARVSVSFEQAEGKQKEEGVT